METLTISTLDDDTIGALRQQAERGGRSVEQEAADLIRKGLGEPKPGWDRKAMLAEADRVAAMTPKGVKQTPSEVLLREDRDR